MCRLDYRADVDHKVSAGASCTLRIKPVRFARDSQAPVAASRRKLNTERSIGAGCSSACSASASPSAAECLKPWPEHAEAKVTLACSPSCSTTNLASGVTVYRQVVRRRHSLETSGKRGAMYSACNAATSASQTVRETASGSTVLSYCSVQIFSPPADPSTAGKPYIMSRWRLPAIQINTGKRSGV